VSWFFAGILSAAAVAGFAWAFASRALRLPTVATLLAAPLVAAFVLLCGLGVLLSLHWIGTLVYDARSEIVAMAPPVFLAVTIPAMVGATIALGCRRRGNG
jgi:hypothetical protein